MSNELNSHEDIMNPEGSLVNQFFRYFDEQQNLVPYECTEEVITKHKTIDDNGVEQYHNETSYRNKTCYEEETVFIKHYKFAYDYTFFNETTGKEETE